MSVKGGKYGYIWAGTSVIALAWYYFFIPELKGRSLEEIDELFENKVPTLEFKSFETKILDKALKDVQDRLNMGEKPVAKVEEVSEEHE